ncbi:hypothetical protein LguiA_032588 [Lonicera macranthoides]
MDFKNLLGGGKTSTEEDDKPEKKPQESTPSSSELLTNAKLVAEAAKSTFSNESDKVDKAKVAEASADLLDAAESYGKLEQTGCGSYLDKAEQYLHNYGSSPAKPAGSGAEAPAKHPTEEKTSGEEEKSEGGGGGGGYMKMAEGFFKK